MTTLLTLRPAPSLWQLDACPAAYDAAGHAQFKAMPGIRWIYDKAAPNSRGFYRGDAVAVRIVADTLSAAGVCKVADGSTLRSVSFEQAHGIYADKQLREYQMHGAHWIVRQLRDSGAALLADDMGIGKSAQAIAAAEAIGARRIQIICPAIVKPHWIGQITKFATNPTDGGVLEWHVDSYEGFVARGKPKAKLPLTPADLVIIDETHYLMNPRAGRSKAIASWLSAQQPRPLIIALTGTPIPTRVRDLWHPLELLWPGRFGSFWLFTRRYCNGQWERVDAIDRDVWKSDGSSRLDELRQRLQACMLRRTKSDVALELPPLTRQVIDVEMPPKAAKALTRAAAAINWAERSLLGSRVTELLSAVETYKLDAAESLAADVRANGGRALLLTLRRDSAAELATRLGAPVVDGSVAADQRRAVIADADLAVATVYSVTTGIDLTGFTAVIFVGLDWSPAVIEQATARLHRIGQLSPVTAYFLCGRGTLDEVVRERVIMRADAAADALGEAGALGKDLGGNEEDILSAMVERMRKAAA